MPPNASLVTVTYNSRTRSEVELEWQVENKAGEGFTGFFLEHMWLSQRPGRRDKSNHSQEEPAAQRIGQPVWYRNVILDPETRSHTVGRLTPTENYQFRITAVNHRTVGHPSAAKTPGTTSPRVSLESEVRYMNQKTPTCVCKNVKVLVAVRNLKVPYCAQLTLLCFAEAICVSRHQKSMRSILHWF